MKKLYIILVSVILILPVTAKSQSYVQDPQGIHVRDSVGQKMISLEKKDDDSFSLRAMGYEIVFSDKNKKTDDAAQTEYSHRGSWSYMGYSGHWAMFELGFNNFTAPDYHLYPDGEKGFLDLNMAKSIYFGWNLLNFSYSLNKAGTIGLTTGLGLVWRNYVFDDNVSIIKEDGMLRPRYLNEDIKKSKMNTFSFFIPLVFEFGQYKGWFFSAGVYADVILFSQTKTKFPKEKRKGNFYLNNLQAGATARFGYNKIYVFGNFGFVNMFNAKKAPQTQPYTIGLGFGF